MLFDILISLGGLFSTMAISAGWFYDSREKNLALKKARAVSEDLLGDKLSESEILNEAVRQNPELVYNLNLSKLNLTKEAAIDFLRVSGLEHLWVQEQRTQAHLGDFPIILYSQRCTRCNLIHRFSHPKDSELSGFWLGGNRISSDKSRWCLSPSEVENS